ncbi:MAG: septum formation family protein [Marmoricola sp.]
MLTLADLSARTDDSRTVPCSTPHTAQTYRVATFPRSVGTDYRAARVGAYAYRTCGPAFESYLGASDSLVLRIQVSWAWFGPSPEAWKRGARWFRCDVVGTPPEQTSMVTIPQTLSNLLIGFPPDRWLTCATGEVFSTRTEVSCAHPHSWRAVTAVKLGQPSDPYPGDHLSQIRANNYCSDAIAAYFNYANTYEYGYTVFHAAEWKAGNRRAVCWAKTTK